MDMSCWADAGGKGKRSQASSQITWHMETIPLCPQLDWSITEKPVRREFFRLHIRLLLLDKAEVWRGNQPTGVISKGVGLLPTPFSSIFRGLSSLALTYLSNLFPHPHWPGQLPILWFALPGLPPPRVTFTIFFDQDLVAVLLPSEDL